MRISLTWIENKSDVLQSAIANKSSLTKYFFIGIGAAGAGLILHLPPLQDAGALLLIGPTAACGTVQIIKSASAFVRKLSHF
jgi:hypothetical protein